MSAQVFPTCSSADTTGASVQEGESDLMEQDPCAMISETLHDQVDRFVIRYLFGCNPLAAIAIKPEKRQNVDQDIKIDQHLVSIGTRLSRADALARYGRTEAAPQDPDDAPLRAEETAKAMGNNDRLPKGENPHAPLQAGQGAAAPSSIRNSSFLIGNSLSPASPVTLANSTQSWYKCPRCGRFDGFDGHCEKCGYTLGANDAKKRTEELLGDAARDAYAKPVTGISYREELGRIDLPVGRIGEWDEIKKQREHGSGLSKLRAKHSEDLEHLPDTLTHGEVLRTRKNDKEDNPEAENRRAIIYKGYVCFVEKGDSGSWIVTTHYKAGEEFNGKLKRIAEAL